MGWTSFHVNTDWKGRVNRKEILDKIFTSKSKTCEWKVEKSIVVGTTYYCAIKRTILDTGERLIFGMVVLTHIDNNCYDNFSYKDMEESMGPYQYDCPMSILNLLDDTDDDYALEWREKCQQLQEYKKARRKLMKTFEIGDKIRTKLWYEEELILTLSLLNGKRKWIDWENRYKYNQSDVFKYDFVKVVEEK